MCGTNRDTAGCGADGRDVVREEGQECLELSNRKPEEIRLRFAIGWMRAEENLLYTSGEVLRLLEAIEGEIEPTGGNRTGSDT